MENDELVQNMLLELRRGTLSGLVVDQSTLYPLLRRLESQGLLQSDWRIMDEARPRRYYVISAQGKTVLSKLKQEWSLMVETMQKMLS
jgi:PadR family transcriptional regulator, regulatory protein PadR